MRMLPRVLSRSVVLLGILPGIACVSREASRPVDSEAPVEAPVETAADESQPHIVIVLADDLGLGDLSFMNADARTSTPHLDAVAAAGIRFTDAHSPSAVCSPTRYGMLTGRYCWRTSLKRGVLWTDDPLLIASDRPTVASELRRHGYHTAFVGKWHLGLGSTKPTDWSGPLDAGPHTVGFEESVGIPSSLDIPPYCWFRNGRGDPPPLGTIEASSHRRQGGDGFWRRGAIAEGFVHAEVLPRTIDEAVAIVERHARDRSAKPLFMQVWLPAPHTPWLPLEPWRGSSEAGFYGDFVNQVDHEVGRLLASIEACGMTEDTLFVFTSDNGAHWPETDVERYGHLANGDVRGQKADIHEGGHRVPMLVRWPRRIDAGIARDEVVCLTDLYATSLAAAGVDPRRSGGGEDSIDLLPLLISGESGGLAARPGVVHHSADGMFAVRVGDWKLIEGLGSGGFTRPARRDAAPGEPDAQLYDLVRDPRETRNLASERPDKVAELQAVLDEIRGGPQP